MKVLQLYILCVSLFPIGCESASLSGQGNDNPDPVQNNSTPSNASGTGGVKTEGGGEEAVKVASQTDNPKSLQPLVGLWNAKGYKCYDATGRLVSVPLEIIKIEEKDGKFVGTKVQGDDCVESGRETFVGTRNGEDLKVQFYGGTPGNEPILDSNIISGRFKSDAIQFDVAETGESIHLTRRASE